MAIAVVNGNKGDDVVILRLPGSRELIDELLVGSEEFDDAGDPVSPIMGESKKDASDVENGVLDDNENEFRTLDE